MREAKRRRLKESDTAGWSKRTLRDQAGRQGDAALGEMQLRQKMGRAENQENRVYDMRMQKRLCEQSIVSDSCLRFRVVVKLEEVEGVGADVERVEARRREKRKRERDKTLVAAEPKRKPQKSLPKALINNCWNRLVAGKRLNGRNSTDTRQILRRSRWQRRKKKREAQRGSFSIRPDGRAHYVMPQSPPAGRSKQPSVVPFRSSSGARCRLAAASPSLHLPSPLGSVWPSGG